MLQKVKIHIVYPIYKYPFIYQSFSWVHMILERNIDNIINLNQEEREVVIAKTIIIDFFFFVAYTLHCIISKSFID